MLSYKPTLHQPGVVNSFVKGSNVKRTRRAHHVTAAALYSLLIQAYDWCKQTEKLFHLVSGAEERQKARHNSTSGT